MGKIYLTSDWHFNHKNVLKFCERTRGHFNSVEEMNQAIIDSVNKTCTEEDTLYNLGDLGIGKPKEIFSLLEQIKPRIIIVGGNHDSQSKLFRYIDNHNHSTLQGIWKYMIEPVGDRLKYNKKVYYLTHFPLGLGEQRKVLRNFCGHIHDETCKDSNVLNVGIDSPEIYPSKFIKEFAQPIKLEDAVALIEDKWRKKNVVQSNLEKAWEFFQPVMFQASKEGRHSMIIPGYECIEEGSNFEEKQEIFAHFLQKKGFDCIKVNNLDGMFISEPTWLLNLSKGSN